MATGETVRRQWQRRCYKVKTDNASSVSARRQSPQRGATMIYHIIRLLTCARTRISGFRNKLINKPHEAAAAAERFSWGPRSSHTLFDAYTYIITAYNNNMYIVHSRTGYFARLQLLRSIRVLYTRTVPTFVSPSASATAAAAVYTSTTVSFTVG